MSLNLKNFLNHERYQMISMIVICIFLAWAYGCESKVRSIKYPTEKVSRPELTAEVEAYLAQAELKYQALDKQDEFKSLIFDRVMLFAQEGTINPIGILTTIGLLLGTGATVDNIRRRKVEKRRLTYEIDNAGPEKKPAT